MRKTLESLAQTDPRAPRERLASTFLIEAAAIERPPSLSHTNLSEPAYTRLLSLPVDPRVDDICAPLWRPRQLHVCQLEVLLAQPLWRLFRARVEADQDPRGLEDLEAPEEAVLDPLVALCGSRGGQRTKIDDKGREAIQLLFSNTALGRNMSSTQIPSELLPERVCSPKGDSTKEQDHLSRDLPAFSTRAAVLQTNVGNKNSKPKTTCTSILRCEASLFRVPLFSAAKAVVGQGACYLTVSHNE